MNFQEFLDQAWGWLLATGIRVLVIFILMMIAVKLAGWLTNRIFSSFGRDEDDPERKKRADTLSSLIRYVLVVSVLAVGLVMILGEFGIAIGPILAAAGIVGLAVGFGAQQLVQDVISGFFIILEDQIRVGDVVQIAGKGGLVEKVNLRMTIIRDLAGNVHFVRNGHIDVVTNMTKEYSRYVFDIGVAYREDVDQVIDVVKQVHAELRQDDEFGKDIIDDIEILGLDQFADSAVIIKARTTTKPIKQWRIGREFNRRLKKKFDELDIEIPFPHTTLYVGQNKDGSSPPLNINMAGEKNSSAAGAK
jgi:small conductance mechanosensitive channel